MLSHRQKGRGWKVNERSEEGKSERGMEVGRETEREKLFT